MFKTILLLILFIYLAYVSCEVKDNVKVTGRLRFQDGKIPDKLQGGSHHLHVTLENANIMDTSSIQLGKFSQKIENFNDVQDLMFEISDAKRPMNGMKASLRAVLNVGWSPNDEETDDWIGSGDFMNDFRHDVDVNDEVDEYNHDILVREI